MLLSQFQLVNPQKLNPVRQSWQKYVGLAGALLLLIFCTGCSQVTTLLRSGSQASTPELTVNQVEPANRPGVYDVTGSTNLPEKTKITVSAVRYLQANPQQLLDSTTEPVYSILARQPVEVNQGKWQASLNLWQVASDGKYQEAWQLHQSDLQEDLNPALIVTFLATVDPVNRPDTLQDWLDSQQDKNFRSELVRFTPDGEWYLQASQTVPIDLPVGSTTPPTVSAEEVIAGSGDRSSIAPENPSSEGADLPPATIDQTDAPLSPEEFLR